VSITKEVTVWCEHGDCSRWEQVNDYESVGGKVSEARKAVKRMGWTYNRDRGDWCPAHSTPGKSMKGR
jgi:alkylated DNA repair dioxygenase AlkB